MWEGLTPLSCNKFFLIGVGCGDLFHSHQIYFYKFWSNLDKCFAKGKIGIIFGELVEDRYHIWRISDTYKKIIYFNFAEISLHASY